MADQVAHGEVRITLNDKDVIEGLRRIDQQFDRSMQHFEKAQAVAQIDANLRPLQNNLKKAQLEVKRLVGEKAELVLKGKTDFKELNKDLDKARLAVQQLDGKKATIEMEVVGQREALRAQQQQLAAMAKIERAAEQAAARERNRPAEIAKQQREYVKLSEAIERAEHSRGGFFRRKIPAIQERVDVDVKYLEEQRKKVRLILESFGEPPPEIDIRVNESRLAKLLGSLADMTVRVGPFTASIKQFAAAASVFAPVIVSLTGAVVALGSALATGIAGGAAIGTAALGGFGQAALGVTFALKPMVKDLQDAGKAEDAYHAQVRKTGANSDQAKKKLAEYEHTLKDIGPAGAQAYRGIRDMGKQFQALTAVSRPAVFSTMAQGVQTIQKIMPQFAVRTNQAITQVTSGMNDWFRSLRGSEARGILDTMFGNANAAIGPLMRGLGSLGAALGRIGASASRYLEPLARSFANWAAGFAKATENSKKLDGTIGTLVTSFRNIMGLLGSVGNLFSAIFMGGNDAGQDLVVTVTDIFNRWAGFLRTTQGKNDMAKFFRDSVAETKAFIGTLAPLIGTFFNLALAVRPLSSLFFKMTQFGANLAAELLKLKPVQVIVTGIGSALAAAFVARRVGDFVNGVKDAVGILKQLNPVAAASAAKTAAVTAAQRVAAGAAKAWAAATAVLNAVMTANPILLVITAIAALGLALVVAYKKSETFRNVVNGAFDGVKAAASAVGTFFKTLFTRTIPRIWADGLNLIIGFVNRIIGVINKIPFIPDIGEISMVTGPTSRSKGPTSTALGQANAGRARGGFVDRPLIMVGEEAPTHPEYVVATNPAYRKRNVGLWMQAGRDLGMPGFAGGGITNALSSVGNTLLSGGKAVAGVAKDVLTWGPRQFIKLLPKIPGGSFVTPLLKGIKNKAIDYIKDKVGLGGGSVGEGVSGSVGNAISLAKRLGFGQPSGGQLTGGKHVQGSYHYQGRAVDFGHAGHSEGQMRQLFGSLLSRYGSHIKELFYDPMGYYIKNGRRVKGAIGGHSDHIHLALRKGGKIAGFKKGGVLNAHSIAAIARGAGFSGNDAVLATAIALAESKGSVRSVSPTGDYGLWQINKAAHPGYFRSNKIFNPQYNAKAAWEISEHGKNFRPWTTFKSGAYKDYLDTARKAVIGTRKGSSGSSGGSGTKSVPAVYGAVSDLANQIAAADARASLASRTVDTADDIAAILGSTTTRKRTTAENHALAVQVRTLNKQMSGGAMEQARALRNQIGKSKTVRTPGQLELLQIKERQRKERLAKIDKALRGKLRPETRKRLLEERATLLGEQASDRETRANLKTKAEDLQFERGFGAHQGGLSELNATAAVADTTGGLDDDLSAAQELANYWQQKLAIATRRNDFEGISEATGQVQQQKQKIAEITQSIAMLPMQRNEALAALTTDLGDDLTSAQQLLDYWNNDFYQALVNGDQAAQITAAGNIAQYQQRVDDIKQQIAQQPIQARQALAALTDTLTDDLSSAQEFLGYWEGVLRAAQAAGDQAKIAEAAGNVASGRQNVKQVQEDIATQPILARQALAKLTTDTTDDIAAAQELLNYYQPLLDAAKAAGNNAEIIRLAPIVGGLIDEIKGTTESMTAQSSNFNQARYDLYKNFGSNYYVPAAAGPQQQPITFNQTFHEMPDPHTFSQSVAFELKAAF